jgi:hypothetical protein
METRLHEERKARKKLPKDMKEVKKVLYPNKTPSPSGSEERESNPPKPFKQRYAKYENFDPSQPFAPYASQAFDAHLLQSSRDLAWLINSLKTSLVVHFPIWLVALTLLGHRSLTHFFTPG